MSDGNHNALPAEMICIVASIVRFTTSVHITTAVNLKPKECWIKPTIIFVIFSDSNKQENLLARLIQVQKTSWKIYSRKAD